MFQERIYAHSYSRAEIEGLVRKIEDSMAALINGAQVYSTSAHHRNSRVYHARDATIVIEMEFRQYSWSTCGDSLFFRYIKEGKPKGNEARFLKQAKSLAGKVERKASREEEKRKTWRY